MEERDPIPQIQIPMDLNDTFGELNPSNLLNLDNDDDDDDDDDDGSDSADSDPDLDTIGDDDNDNDDALALSCEEPTIGMEFDSDESAKEFYTAYARKSGFSVRMNKSRRSRKDESIIMRRFVCTKEGFHSKRVVYDDGKKKRKRGTAREGCMAMIEVVKKDQSLSLSQNHCKWVLTKLVTQHTHLLPPLQSQSQSINGDNNGMNMLCDCTNSMSNNNRGNRGNYPFGEGGEGQGLLEYLKRMQAKNPSFFYAVQVDNSNCMTNIFWADAKARLSYPHFRDAVTFDTTYRKTKYMMPFACFRGVNHHFQSLNLGCCLLMDESKGSYIWLFETWLACMAGSHPLLLLTDKDKAMETAVSRVFPSTRHRFCQEHLLSRCKHKLSDVCLKHPTLKADLKACVTGSSSVQEFDSRWEYLLQKYNMWDNVWLQSLYQIKDKWADVFQKGFFFPHLFLSHRHESLNKFFKRNFNAKTSLLVFINCFNQDLASRRQDEARADFETMHTKPRLKTPSLIEKQAADVYTRAVFDEFQEEFVQSLGYYVEMENDGQVAKYSLRREEEEGENQRELHVVSFTQPNNRASCTCGKFEYSGILCRHILRVFFIVGVRTLPKEYILQRWTKNAASVAPCLNERDGILEEEEEDEQVGGAMVEWYNDLCREGVRFGMEGGVSAEVYKIARNALQKAFSQVLNEKNKQIKGQQQNVTRYGRLQKVVKLPLPKLQPKKAPLKPQLQLEDNGAQESSRF